MKNKSKSFSIAAAAALSVISFLLLYAAELAPSGKIALICMSLIPICAAIIEFGKKTGICCSICVSLLILIFGANKIFAAAFAVICAPFPVLKLIFESRRKIWELTGKGIYFLIISLIAALSAYHVLNQAFLLTFGAVFISAVLTDYALTVFITIYIQKIHKLIFK